MPEVHYFNRPLNIDRTTQLSTTDGPLGDQKFSLIAQTGCKKSWAGKGDVSYMVAVRASGGPGTTVTGAGDLTA